MSLVATLYLLCGCDLVQCGQSTDNDPVKNTILSIQKEVVDLTAPVEPLYCKTFLTARKSMSKETAEQIIKLIQHGDLTVTQSEIGVLLLSGLPERVYWKSTEQLLTTTTPEGILETILNQPLPYGPSYANAYKEEKYSKILLELKNDKNCSRELKPILDLILSGKASKIYEDYLKHPDKYGY